MTATPLAFVALRDRPAWLDEDGATPVCAETDPELWFPEKGESSRVAKRLCGGCPLRAACREWVLSHPTAVAYGVWGGLTEQERRVLLRRSRRLGVDVREAA